MTDHSTRFDSTPKCTGTACILPFTWNNVTYTDCIDTSTLAEAPDLDSPWCPVEVATPGGVFHSTVHAWGVCQGQSINCEDTSVEVTTLFNGKGTPELFEITTFGVHQQQSFLITTAIGNDLTPRVDGQIKGTFKLRIPDLLPYCWSRAAVGAEKAASLDRCVKGGITDEIDSAAVAMTADEGNTHARGSDYGESVESKLKALLVMKGIDIRVTRSTLHAQGGFSWTVTFVNAPYFYDKLEVVESTLHIDSILEHVNATSRTLQAPNKVEGTFRLSHEGHSTVDLAASSSSQDVRAALLDLSSVQDNVLNLGDIAVARSLHDKVGGHTWIVAFLEGHSAETPNLNALGASLLGHGAGVTSRRIQSGSSDVKFALTHTDGSKVVSGDPVLGSASVVLRGSLNALNYALQVLTFAPSPTWNGRGAVRLSINDNGNTGGGGAKTGVLRVPFVVSPVNTAPKIVRPASYSNASYGTSSATLVVREDAGLHITGLSVADPDAFNTTVSVRASDGGHCRFGKFGQSSGASSSGGSGSRSDGSGDVATVFGTLEEVNDALKTLVYHPREHFNGRAYLSVTVTDHGTIDDETNDALGNFTETFIIGVQRVNDGPKVVATSANVTIDEDTILAFDGLISFSDADMEEPSNLLSVAEIAVQSPHGSFSFDGVPLGLHVLSPKGAATGQRASGLYFRGSQKSVAAALRSVLYTPDLNFNGEDIINVTALDTGNTGLMFEPHSAFGRAESMKATLLLPVTVRAVNDVPRVVSPAEAIMGLEDATVSISGISLLDDDHPLGDGNVSCTVVVHHGAITLTPLRYRNDSLLISFDEGNGLLDSRLVMNGSTADLSIALSDVLFRPSQNWNSWRKGAASIEITARDQEGGSSPTATVFISVAPSNDAPVLLVPGSVFDPILRTMDQLSHRISHVRTLVVDEDSTVTMTNLGVRDVDVDEGSSLLQLTLVSANGHLVVDTGSAVHLMAEGSQGAKASRVTFVVSSVNANATLSSIRCDRVIERYSYGFVSHFHTHSPPRARPPLCLSPTSTTLASIPPRYSPKADYHGDDTIEIMVSDLGNKGAVSDPVPTSTKLSPSGIGYVDTQVIPVRVVALNDPPVVVLPSAAQSVLEDSELVIEGIAVHDVDIDAERANATLEVTVAVQHGRLSLTDEGQALHFLIGNKTLDGYMKFEGNLREINRALASCTYVPNQDWNSAYSEDDAIVITVNDRGNWGLNGTSSAHEVEARLAISVTPANDAPVIHMPQEHLSYDYGGDFATTAIDVLHVNEDEDLQIPIRVTDIDLDEAFGSNIMQVDLSVSTGTLRVDGSLAGLYDNGIGARSLGFAASISRVNDVLGALVYRGLPNFNGNVTLTVTCNDMGNTGSVGSNTVQALTASKTLRILVRPVNDPPSWTQPPGFLAVAEDSSVVLSGIQIVDPDIPLLGEPAAGSSVGRAVWPANVSDAHVEVEIYVESGVVSLTRIGPDLTLKNYSTKIASSLPGTGILESHIVFTGPLHSCNRALGEMMYKPESSAALGFDTIKLYVDDLGNIGSRNSADGSSGGSNGLSASTDVYVHIVRGYNDAPVVVVPGATRVTMPCEQESFQQRDLTDAPHNQECHRIVEVATISGLEDVPLAIENVRVEDPDCDEFFSGMMTVTLGCHNCTLYMSETSGLHFVEPAPLASLSAQRVEASNFTFQATLVSVPQSCARGGMRHLRHWFLPFGCSALREEFSSR